MIVVDAAELSASFSAISPAVSKKLIISPHFQFEAVEDSFGTRLAVKANDQVQEIISFCSAKGETDGDWDNSYAFDAISGTVKTWKGEVKISFTQEGSLLLTNGKRRATLTPITEDEINPIEIDREEEFGERHFIPTDDLWRKVDEVRRAAQKANTGDPKLSSVHVKSDGIKMYLAATNGISNLAVSEMPTPSPLEFDTLIPIEKIQGIKAFEGNEHPATFGIGAGRIEIATPWLIWRTRVVYSANYPNVQGVIPQGQPFVSVLDRREFISAIENAARYASDSSFPWVKLLVSAADQEVVVERHGPKGGISVPVDAEITMDGADSHEMAANSEALLDALKGISESRVRVLMQNERTPIVFEPVEATGSKQLISPAIPG